MSKGIELKSNAEFDSMKAAGRIVADILDELEDMVRPGLTTWELDQAAERAIFKRKAKPAFKGYMGFPACVCISVNDEVVHGIPSKKKVLEEGDLLKLDFGVVYKGFFGDSARTVPVGVVTPEAARLIDVTRRSLEAGLRACVAGARLGDVGHAVQSVAEGAGFAVVRDFTGHGIGRKLHEAPNVPNYGSAGSGGLLRAGMALAIEPMVNAGSEEVDILDDDWTAVTADGALSAHFEHTILLTENGPVIATASSRS